WISASSLTPRSCRSHHGRTRVREAAPGCLDADPSGHRQRERKLLRAALSLGPDWRGYADEREAGLQEVRMDWASDAASKRQFEGFAADASRWLLRTGYLMTGDV